MGFEQEFKGTDVTKIPNTLWLLEGGDGVEVSLHSELWESAP